MRFLKAIQQASQSYAAAKMMDKPGHVPMLVWHDESESFDCSGSIPGISVINSLSKTFPISGQYKGGMILRLYAGIGVGIVFTKRQVRKLLGRHTFRNVTRMYETPSSVKSGSQLPPKQRRQVESLKVKQTELKKQKRKAEIARLQSYNVAKLSRLERSKELACCGEKTKEHTKLTFGEAASRVCSHAKTPSVVVSDPVTCEGRDADMSQVVSLGDGFEEYFSVGDDDIVESWSGPLLPYDMTGWRKVSGGFVRPLPSCPCRGMCIRETTVKFEWQKGMKELILELLTDQTASSAPCEYIANQLMLDGRWSDLDCPSTSRVKNFVQAHFSRHKQAAKRALSRKGKRSYDGLPLQWLKDEVTHRNMTVGRRQIPGCIKLLEQHDDDNEGKLSKYHCPPPSASSGSVSTGSRAIGLAAFRSLIEKHRQAKSKLIPKREWYVKECAYQDIEPGRRTREAGMIKLLHKHYNTQAGIVKRHDGNHTVNSGKPYKLNDQVEVLWKGSWWPAIVIKCHSNNTWDVEYPVGNDQVFCTRLPCPLLRTKQ